MLLVSLKLAPEPSGDSGKMSCTMSAFLPFLGSKRLQKETKIEAALLRRWHCWICEPQGINKPRSPLAQIWRNNQLRAVS